MNERGQLKLFACRSGKDLAQEVAKNMSSQLSRKHKQTHIELNLIGTTDFADSETESEVPITARGSDAYLIQQCNNPNDSRSVYDNLYEALESINALRISGAEKVTLVLPYHPSSRKDRSNGRVSIGGRLLADLITTAGASNVITFDLHTDQMEGFYNLNQTKIDNLKAFNVLLPYLETNFLQKDKKVTVLAPDAGAGKKAEKYANKLGAEIAFGYKKRAKANEVSHIKINGKLEKTVIVPDDMIDTGGTMMKLIQKIRSKKNNVEDIILACTHPLLNGKAIKRFANEGITIIGTDTIYRDKEFLDANPWYHQVSIAPTIADAIIRLNGNLSLNPVYRSQN